METDPVLISTVHTPPPLHLHLAPTRIAWNAVLGGAAVAVASWMVLQLVGMALGLAVVDVDNASSVKSAAIGAGIWSGAAPVIACFAGGLVAGRATHAATRLGNAITGVVVWSLATIGGLVALSMLVSTLVGGAVSAGGSVVGAAGTAAASAATGLAGQAGNVGDLVKSAGLNANDALGPVNQRLRAEGKPAITAAQLEAAAKDVIGDAVRTGKLDRAMLTSSIAEETSLSQADADNIAGRVQARYEKVRAEVDAKLAEAKDKAKAAAQATATATSKALFGLFCALVLAFSAAVAGSILGGRTREEAEPVAVARPRRA